MGVMITALLVLAPIAYGFAPEMKLTYDVKVGFEGFIPVLGGQEGKVDVLMGVAVDGLSPEGAHQRAASEIKKFKLSFNGAELPLTVDSIKDFFPRTTIQFTPGGRITKTDAPDLKLPVRLPGLDAKRFPDITYLPIEFPEGDVRAGSEWEFKKSFGDSDVVYKCTAAKVTDEAVEVEMTMNQTYTVFENEAKEVVVDRKDAVNSVATTMTGSGRAVFDRKRGLVKVFSANGNSVSTVTDLKTKAESRRTLKMALDVALKEKEAAPTPKPTGIVDRAKEVWSAVVAKGEETWSKTKGYYLMARAAFASATAALGIPLDRLWSSMLEGWRGIFGG